MKEKVIGTQRMILGGARSLRRRFRRRVKAVEESLVPWRIRTISRRRLLDDIRVAASTNQGFAMGKIGRSQQYWMYYPIMLEKTRNLKRLAPFERKMLTGLKQVGLFPATKEFYLEYNDFYIEQVSNLDCLGLCYVREEPALIAYYGLEVPFIHYDGQEPDRSVPSDEDNCYLPYFKGKKILIICPFAKALQERANQVDFEAVWANTGKKWFHPASVDALEFPYGFDPETHKRYGTALELLDDILDELDRRDFDVALIGAGGLAIPIASDVKNRGKIGIDLGGHLQILFGVQGKRWRSIKWFQEKYVNEHWIDTPAKYRPKVLDVCDGGAYW